MTIEKTGKSENKIIMLKALKELLNSQSCLNWLLLKLHPNGIHCYKCRQALPENSIKKFAELRRVQCKACGKRYTAFTGTIMEGAKISPDDFFLLAFLFTFDLRTKDIVEITRLSRQVIAVWRRKISIWQEIGLIANG